MRSTCVCVYDPSSPTAYHIHVTLSPCITCINKHKPEVVGADGLEDLDDREGRAGEQALELLGVGVVHVADVAVEVEAVREGEALCSVAAMGGGGRGV